jgi:hypothetical protein
VAVTVPPAVTLAGLALNCAGTGVTVGVAVMITVAVGVRVLVGDTTVKLLLVAISV